MYFCAKCGAPYQDSDVPAVCKNCGNVLKTAEAVTEPAPETNDAYAAPVAPAAPPVSQAPSVPPAPDYYSAPAYTPTYTPGYTPAPESSHGAGPKVMSIIGMVMGIVSVFGIIYTLIYAFVPIVFIAEVIFGVFFIGAGVAARCLGNKAYYYGRTNGMTKAAKITGLIGIIANAVCVGLGLIIFIAWCSRAYYF